MSYLSVQCLKCVLVILSFDNYNEENDVKDYERRHRASSDQPQPKPFTVIGGAPIPKWGDFTNLPANKRNLNNHFCEFIETTEKAKLRECDNLIIGGGFIDIGIAKQVTSSSSDLLPDMKSNQSESDCRIFPSFVM